MKLILLFILFVSINCSSKDSILQPFGSSSTMMISLPCKLFKYYEKNQLFYDCKDPLTNTTFIIKETKHKDAIDRIINTIDQNLYKDGKVKIDSTTYYQKQKLLDNFFKKNPSGYKSKILNNDAIFVDLGLTKKVFFSDAELIVSYEIIISGVNKNLVDSIFNNCIKSLMFKKDNLKKLL